MPFDGSGIPLLTSANIPQLHSFGAWRNWVFSSKGRVFIYSVSQSDSPRKHYQTFHNIPFPVCPFKAVDSDTDDESEIENYEPPIAWCIVGSFLRFNDPESRFDSQGIAFYIQPEAYTVNLMVQMYG